jgi:hypothetical protein
MIELYTDHPYLRFYYDQVDRQTREWDGKNLILDLPANPAASSAAPPERELRTS